ncbi:MAG: hypothetical protein U9R74_19285 [Pseudomonadota bacterium]|nr:hypothetical protein [Pseudomonadota bacterium]
MATSDANTPMRFTLIVSPDEDEEFRDDLARQLRRESEEIDGVVDASLVMGGPAPEGARNVGELVSIGQVALEVLPIAIPSVIALVQAWMLRDSNRSTRIKIGDTEVDIPVKMSPEQVQLFIEGLRGQGRSGNG